jgi:hypothetical protein
MAMKNAPQMTGEEIPYCAGRPFVGAKQQEKIAGLLGSE